MDSKPQFFLALEDELLLKIIRKNHWVDETKIQEALIEKQKVPDANLASIFYSLGYLGPDQENAFSVLMHTGGIQMKPHSTDIFDDEALTMLEGTQVIVPIRAPSRRKSTVRIEGKKEQPPKKTKSATQSTHTTRLTKKKHSELLKRKESGEVQIPKNNDLQPKNNKKRITSKISPLPKKESEEFLELSVGLQHFGGSEGFSSDETLIPEELRTSPKETISPEEEKKKKKKIVRCPHCQKKVVVSAKKKVRCKHCQEMFSPPSRKSSKIKEKTAVHSSVAKPQSSSKNLFASYEIIKELGRGGMGVVYKVYHTKEQEYYALKILSNDEEVNPERLMRFKREARAMAQLNHPNIVRVYDFGNFEGQCYFTMDLIEGESVDQWITKKKKVPELLALEMMIKVTEAVDYAHKKDIIHRDLKPENILIDFTGEPYLMDFGLAKIQKLGESRLTQSGLAVGTPAFMSPEQAMGDLENVDQNSDVFALGTILYNMITGRPPFYGTSPVSVMKKIISTDPVLPRKLNSRLSRGMESIIMKALEKEKIKRYKDAEELNQDLKNLAQGKPLIAKPPKSRPVRFLIRNRLPLMAVGFFFTAFLGFLAYYLSFFSTKPSLPIPVPPNERAKQYTLQDLPQLKVRIQNYIKLNAPNDAIKHLQIVKDLEGESPEYFLEMARCYMALKFPAKALEYLDAHLKIYATPYCLLLRGECYLRLWDYRRANYEFSEALKSHQERESAESLSQKDLYWLYVNRGNARFQIEDSEGAFSDWQNAQKMETQLRLEDRIDLTDRIKKVQAKLGQ